MVTYRIVFRSNGGNDTLIGNPHPQDVIEMPAGSLPEDYGVTENDDGTTTLGGAANSVTYYDIDDDDASALAPADPASGPPPDDILVGTSGSDLVFGFAGTDFIVVGAGADFVGPGAGSDFTDGEAGRDVLGDDDDDDMFGGDDDNRVNVVDGGQGEDVFIFGSATAAHGDTIRGFQAGDKIDLSGIDANTGAVGNDTFTLEAGQATTAPGQIVVTHETREDGEYTVVSGNTTGNDNAPEFRISIAGNHDLAGTDFNL